MGIILWAILIAIVLVMLWMCWNITRPNELDDQYNTLMGGKNWKEQKRWQRSSFFGEDL
jgi:cyanate permease